MVSRLCSTSSDVDPLAAYHRLLADCRNLTASPTPPSFLLHVHPLSYLSHPITHSSSFVLPPLFVSTNCAVSLSLVLYLFHVYTSRGFSVTTLMSLAASVSYNRVNPTYARGTPGERSATVHGLLQKLSAPPPDGNKPRIS